MPSISHPTNQQQQQQRYTPPSSINTNLQEKPSRPDHINSPLINKKHSSLESFDDESQSIVNNHRIVDPKDNNHIINVGDKNQQLSNDISNRNRLLKLQTNKMSSSSADYSIQPSTSYYN